MDRTRKIVVTVWVLLGVTLLIALDWQFGGLRFVSPRLDYLAGIASLWLPAVSVILLGFVPRSRARVWGFVCLVPFAAFCLFVSLIGAAVTGFIRAGMLSTDIDPTFARQSATRLGYSDIVVYFSDAGAMDSGEVVVQQEITILPGLLWVRPISHQECLRDVQIKVLNRHHVECSYVADHADTLDPSPEAKQEDAWVF